MNGWTLAGQGAGKLSNGNTALVTEHPILHHGGLAAHTHTHTHTGTSFLNHSIPLPSASLPRYLDVGKAVLNAAGTDPLLLGLDVGEQDDRYTYSYSLQGVLAAGASSYWAQFKRTQLSFCSNVTYLDLILLLGAIVWRVRVSRWSTFSPP